MLQLSCNWFPAGALSLNSRLSLCPSYSSHLFHCCFPFFLLPEPPPLPVFPFFYSPFSKSSSCSYPSFSSSSSYLSSSSSFLSRRWLSEGGKRLLFLFSHWELISGGLWVFIKMLLAFSHWECLCCCSWEKEPQLPFFYIPAEAVN